MKATVNLDDRLYRLVKIRAAEEGVTVTSIFETALQRFLNEARANPAGGQSGRFELPVLAGSGGLVAGVDLSNGEELQVLFDADRPWEQSR